MTISRRNFARLAATSSAIAVASPAIAQGAIKWRLASSFPKNIDVTWGASLTLAKYVDDMSDGKFTIHPFAAGEIVPGLQVLDAVANGRAKPVSEREFPASRETNREFYEFGVLTVRFEQQ